MDYASLRDKVGSARDWWVGELAKAFTPPRRSAPPWRGMLLRTEQGFDVFVRTGGPPVLVGRLDAAAPDAESQRIAGLLHSKGALKEALVLRLSPNEVIASQLTLPAAIRDVLPAVVRNKIEVVSPWPAGQTFVAFEPRSSDPSDTVIRVDVWIAAKARIDRYLAALAEVGIEPGIVDSGTSTDEEPRYSLIGSSADDLSGPRRLVSTMLKAAAIAAMVTVGGLAVYGQVLGRRLATLEESVQRETQAHIAASRPQDAVAQRRWLQAIEHRNSVASTAVSMELLSRSLPDDAYLERIEMRNGVLTFSGMAQSSADLISRLEAVRHFHQVQFAAPTTRKEGEQREEFSLSVRLKPIFALNKADRP